MAVPKVIDVISDAVSIGTTGIVDIKKGRVNVPFSSAQGRTAAKSLINSGSAFQANRQKVDAEFDRPYHRQGSAAAGALAAAIVGAGAGGALAGGPSAAGAAAGGSGAGAASGVLGSGVGASTLGAVAGGLVGAQAANTITAVDQTKAAEKALKEQQDRIKAMSPIAPTVSTSPTTTVRQRRSFSTLLTTPRGLADKAPVSIPTLLGGSAGRRTLG